MLTYADAGKPKGVLHTTGGYMVWAATTFKYTFDHRPGEYTYAHVCARMLTYADVC
jgi:acyl-coenzyme A synthetase/AMP-(fatty) acid ligase